MFRTRLATALAAVLAAFIIVVGLFFILAPAGFAPGFGIPVPQGGTGYFDIKGVRDITSGLVPLALLLTGHRRALGWALLATAFTPLGDAVIVLSHHGPVATALGVHAATAALVLATSALLLTEPKP
ncbi:DUF4267 domain-containing protein [Kitasatospora sp. MMS16-BH015]|uniref:DUF4267 domain-containing protein n=1 Tax=Kitasatospora sp. MMS16-BH015 TaxID=2018025 RepID=UPI000CF2AF79|nr:DUF4267 domain-containing protein [Kitasatospora sp. MMS16-BH015]